MVVDLRYVHTNLITCIYGIVCGMLSVDCIFPFECGKAGGSVEAATLVSPCMVYRKDTQTAFG